MKSLLDLEKDLQQLSDELVLYKSGLEKIKQEEAKLFSVIEKSERLLHEKTLSLCNLKEIYRIAKYQFSRLRSLTEPILNETDLQELNKWIGRARTEEGLLDIKLALLELDKFYPSDIKSNLYALIQKIIIGGAFSKKS